MNFSISFFILLMIALLLMYMSVVRLWSFLRLKYVGKKTSGLVVGFGDPSESPFYKNKNTPVIEYSAETQLLNGKPLNYFPNTLSYYSKGRSMIVFYDKTNPEKFVVHQSSEHVIAIITLLAGIGILATAFRMLYFE
ncbi:DUF3592 domain-containing protein [Gynurincola endophyticus]|jgi:hypothetical protein|uniref:DUF3592 domain-containing protein n=1 Tax=Gynurincola endophyticus TaxID=2479004 RepID=UPI000F8DDE24|nr:DUF3592 domain-containing protein [Gynurincola endophyticus]